jgi:hypothetical protein
LRSWLSGWPPTGDDFKLRGFTRYAVRPGSRVQILYSVAGSTPAHYADKGVRVTVRQGSRTESVVEGEN